jgi:hypothetical protein
VGAGRFAMQLPARLKDIVPATSPTEWYVMVKLEGFAPSLALLRCPTRSRRRRSMDHPPELADGSQRAPGTRNATQS